MLYQIARRKSYIWSHIVLFSIILAGCFGILFTAEAADREIVVSFTTSNSWEGSEGMYYQYDVSIFNGTGSRMDDWMFRLDR